MNQLDGEKIMEKQTSAEEKERKPYSKPQIIHELELETRAGSIIPGIGSPEDPLGTNP
jgi:hypothetical protein